MVGNSSDETKFSHKLLLTNTQISKLHKTSETQLSKMIQSGGFIELMDKMFGPAMTVALEVLGIINSIDKGKSLRKALLDARYNLVNNKIDINLQHYQELQD